MIEYIILCCAILLVVIGVIYFLKDLKDKNSDRCSGCKKCQIQCDLKNANKDKNGENNDKK